MDVLVNLLHGLINIFTPLNFAVMVIGLVLGMLVAVLPGLTLVMGVVLALPFTYKMGVEPALILLTAMYASGTYGGAITSILFRIPGEPMDVPLLWDGYAMTRRGEAAKALGYSLMAALIGGPLSAIVMVALSEPVAHVALSFSSPEFFAITAFGLASVVALGGGSLVNALISLCIGLLIASVGVDAIYGAERLAFGIPFLQDGIEFLLVMVGAYGIGEVLTVGRRQASQPRVVLVNPAVRRRASRPHFRAWRSCWRSKAHSFAAQRPASRWVSCQALEQPSPHLSRMALRASSRQTARAVTGWATAHPRGSSPPSQPQRHR